MPYCVVRDRKRERRLTDHASRVTCSQVFGKPISQSVGSLWQEDEGEVTGAGHDGQLGRRVGSLVQATAVVEVGRVIHESMCRGQFEGGTLQAIGYALTEEMKMKDGHYLNDRLTTYIIPTMKDSPRMDVTFLDRPTGEWKSGQPRALQG